MITLTVSVQSSEFKPLLAEEIRSFKDIDLMEMSTNDLMYKVAEIARDELLKLRRESFLRDNPELTSNVAVDELSAGTPF